MSHLYPRLGAGVAAIAAVGASTAAQANWRFARWGMTASEVVAASSGSVRQVESDRGRGILQQERLAVGSVTEDGVDYEVNSYFSPQRHRLTYVDLIPASDRCDDVLSAYSARLGAGDRKRTEYPDALPGGAALITITKWRDAGERQRVQFTDVATPGRRICKLIFGEQL